MAELLLEAEAVSKRFGGVRALDGASLSVRTGRTTALIGPNGAGKTTLFAIASGFVKPDSGRICYRGKDVSRAEPHTLARLGIARTFQLVQPFAGLTVRDNLMIGAHLRHRTRAAAIAAAEVVAEHTGLSTMLDRPATDLTVAGRKRLELARALATEPALLLLDEVLAGLNPSEVRDLLPVIRGLTCRGITVLMIEHIMRAVMSLADDVFVLAEGRMIAHGSPAAIAGDPAVIEAYLGYGAATSHV